MSRSTRGGRKWVRVPLPLQPLSVRYFSLEELLKLGVRTVCPASEYTKTKLENERILAETMTKN